jgi:hypothetical protein
MPSEASVETFASPFDVPPNYRAPTNFSPRVERAFRGLRISAPEEATFAPGESVDRFGSFANIPISVTLQFGDDYTAKFGNVTEHLVVVAVSGRTNRSYSSTLESHDARAPRRTAASAPAPSGDGIVGVPIRRSYFTFNLAQYLPLPRESDVYDVHVTLEEHQSNVVTIRLDER